MTNVQAKLLSAILSITHIIPVGAGLWMGIESLFIIGCIGVGLFYYINVKL